VIAPTNLSAARLLLLGTREDIDHFVGGRATRECGLVVGGEGAAGGLRPRRRRESGGLLVGGERERAGGGDLVGGERRTREGGASSSVEASRAQAVTDWPQRVPVCKSLRD
jgi:hypothetical protein